MATKTKNTVVRRFPSVLLDWANILTIHREVVAFAMGLSKKGTIALRVIDAAAFLGVPHVVEYYTHPDPIGSWTPMERERIEGPATFVTRVHSHHVKLVCDLVSTAEFAAKGGFNDFGPPTSRRPPRTRSLESELLIQAIAWGLGRLRAEKIEPTRRPTFRKPARVKRRRRFGYFPEDNADQIDGTALARINDSLAVMAGAPRVFTIQTPGPDRDAMDAGEKMGRALRYLRHMCPKCRAEISWLDIECAACGEDLTEQVRSGFSLTICSGAPAFRAYSDWRAAGMDDEQPYHNGLESQEVAEATAAEAGDPGKGVASAVDEARDAVRQHRYDNGRCPLCGEDVDYTDMIDTACPHEDCGGDLTPWLTYQEDDDG